MSGKLILELQGTTYPKLGTKTDDPMGTYVTLVGEDGVPIVKGKLTAVDVPYDPAPFQEILLSSEHQDGIYIGPAVKETLDAYHDALLADVTELEWKNPNDLLSSGPDPGKDIVKALREAIGSGMDEPVMCPAHEDTTNHPSPLHEVIIHLNDHHRWDREKIASWLDTLDIDLKFKGENNGNED